jgi:3-deoxy-D-manno-octulosonate 8-phosphate phosphatase (KDO 8-P phosphatase)
MAKKKLKGESLKKALAKVKVLILDMDGVMTDGRVFWTEGSGWGAAYSVIDGFGIRSAMKAGIEVCFISGGSLNSHRKRAEQLRIHHAYFGDENKLVAYGKIKADLKVTDADCAYVGDELFDIPVMEKAAFSAAPPHAPVAVKKAASYVTKREGGFGCVREITDMILEAMPKKAR